MIIYASWAYVILYFLLIITLSNIWFSCYCSFFSLFCAGLLILTWTEQTVFEGGGGLQWWMDRGVAVISDSQVRSDFYRIMIRAPVRSEMTWLSSLLNNRWLHLYSKMIDVLFPCRWLLPAFLFSVCSELKFKTHNIMTFFSFLLHCTTTVKTTRHSLSASMKTL